ncbi:MAG: YhjD/YihY/BrkB family envelope integrity protein [Bacteroidales bacterium]
MYCSYRDFLRRIQAVFIGIIGLVILLWSVMQVLGHIEKSFNDIWQIRKSRPWVRKFSDYISMIFGPVFLILASSFTVYVSTTVDTISDKVGVINTIKPAIGFLIKIAPFFIYWIESHIYI